MDLITIYFIYGLSFFSMGLAILLEVNRSSRLEYARALMPLARFGLVHGAHEWMEMFLLIRADTTILCNPIAYVRIALLAVSFFFLIFSGARLIFCPNEVKPQWRLILAIAGIWLGGLVWVFATHSCNEAPIAADVYTRYALAIPGAALTAWGLVLQQRKFFQAGMKGFGRDVIVAAIAFGLYGGIGQLFTTPSTIFPSQFVNEIVFQAWSGFPIQIFRSAVALVIAIAMISSLRAFEEETQRQIESLREAQLREQEEREQLRAELLRRTVRAQESERQRIARELHDEMGQTLTALGLGLRAISNGMSSNPGKVKEQTYHMLKLVDSCFDGLQNLISGLHPPQLDDFGLMATLRWYTRQVHERYGLSVELTAQGEEIPLPDDVRIVLYRIVQEALTNIIRHAQTQNAKVHLVFNEDEICIRIEDSGCGFDVEAALQKRSYPCWGLLGMVERARLVGGECRILSVIGAGTLVEVCAPIHKKSEKDDTPAVGR